MEVGTGQTVVESILSLDADNNPVSGATFDVVSLKNGSEYTGVTLSVAISDASRGIFSASWSADTVGDYQFYIKNNITNVIFISDTVSVKSDEDLDTTVYIGI